MRVESPANFPIIGTHKANNMHPHQSVFYDRQNLLDEEDEDNGGKVQKNEEFGLPTLYSMQFNKKIFNNRLQNDPENLGLLVTGITKDINEISQLTLSLEKYGHQTQNLK